jgi:hypothetical protein
MAAQIKSLLTAKKQRGKPPIPLSDKQREVLQAHAFQPGQSGNPSGRPAKPFTAALLRIVEKKIANDPDGRALLDAIAQQLVAKASKGDLASIRELADRIEGTPQRSITLGGDGSGIPIEIASMTREQKQQRIAEILAKARGIEN